MTYKGAVYYRSGSTTQILNGSALERFIVQHVVDANWDEQVLTEFKSADLDIKAIDDFREKAIVRGRLTENARQDSPEQLCAKLGLMRDNHYTNAAVLLFAANSERWLVGSYTKIAFFRSQAGILYHHEVYGPLLAQVDKTVEVLTSLYLKGIVDYVGLERRERYFVPQAALRESIINALCHNRYQSRNPVQIRVTEETLTVDNNGSLPFGWTLDRLLGEHRSQPSNPLLARMFFTAGYIEAYGQGIGRIFESCAQAGAPEPEYNVDGTSVAVVFRASGEFISLIKAGESVSSDDRHGPLGGRQSADKGRKEDEEERPVLSQTQCDLLELLRQDPGMTQSALASVLGVSPRRVRVYLKELKDKGLVRREGSDRRGRWIVEREGIFKLLNAHLSARSPGGNAAAAQLRAK